MDSITRHRLSLLDLDGRELENLDLPTRLSRIYGRFIERLPFENLSANRAFVAHPDQPDKWPRATDCLLRENRACGFGGTSFSLAYALRDLLHGAHANAACTVGRNLVTEEVHAAVIVFHGDERRLYDPALLACGPVPLRPGGLLEDPLGDIRVEPRDETRLTVLLAVRGERPRPVYEIVPVPTPPHRFRQAWVASCRRGRPQHLRIARRVGNEIRRFHERPGRLEVLTCEGRRQVPLGPARARDLCAMFGIGPQWIEEWLGRGDGGD